MSKKHSPECRYKYDGIDTPHWICAPGCPVFMNPQAPLVEAPRVRSVGPFTTQLLDPPWPERGGGKIKRGADRHYSLIKTRADMARVILQSGVWDPADDAHCYAWVTNNYLTWGLWLMDALGFRYVTNVVWVKTKADGKTQIGLGQYFRGAHELLLFGVRGKGASIRTDRKDLPSVVHAERSKHSRKPGAFYELIEARSSGPYVELFARSERPDWTSWGNEVGGAE